MKSLSLASRVKQYSRRLTVLTLATAALLLCNTTIAQTYSIDNLIIDKVFTFATPPGAQTAGGYLTITNTGVEDDTLIGGSASFADVTQMHEMKMVDDIMKMRHLETGLAIPAGATVELTPGGLHVMFMQLTQDLKDGDSPAVTLSFAKAGDLIVNFQVVDRRQQKSGNETKHGHKKSDHSTMNHDSSVDSTTKE